MALARLSSLPTLSTPRRLSVHSPPLPPPPPPYLRELKTSHFSPVNYLDSCFTKHHLLQLHARLLRAGALFRHSAAFLVRAAACDLSYSLLVLAQLPGPTTAHYNALLRTAAPALALRLYASMRGGGLPGDTFTSSVVLKSCAKTTSFQLGRQVHATILRAGQQSDSLLLTALMSFYASCGDGDSARHVFDEMPVRDTVAWNVLISSYVASKRTKDALSLFDIMQSPEYGCDPDDVTCLLLLQACANLGALEFGQQMHRYVEEHGYIGALNLRNSLIAMYLRCGCVDKAYRVFCETQDKNVVSWSTMISGLAMNGFGRDAIEAFQEMCRVGVSPDEHTFTGVLSACSHSGLVVEGMRYFDMMRTEYGLVPNVHHYGCMVDLLGRAGLLDQAYSLIVNEMGVEPDATIWRTLLGTCRIHRHVELGERVIEHLIELKAQQAGDYVLLLNIYSSVGNWEKVAQVRRLMKDKAIQTTPGCSTIELKGVVHAFIVDDESHPRKKEIYEMLNEIGGQLKIAGYVADMESELHDMETEKKESALSYHSEKLAIAFGMVATPPGTTLRIAKNLRICVDCHTFCKVLSSVYNRLLIVRDRSRFHHLQEGQCSCNDYW